MIYKTFILSFSITLIIVGCANNNPNETSTEKSTSQEKKDTVDSNVIKVYVEQDGKITANGDLTSLDGLDSAFNKLKLSNGTVYYSRANAQGEPPAGYMKVMELIIKYSLPVRLYTDKTFSVVVQPN